MRLFGWRIRPVIEILLVGLCAAPIHSAVQFTMVVYTDMNSTQFLESIAAYEARGFRGLNSSTNSSYSNNETTPLLPEEVLSMADIVINGSTIVNVTVVPIPNSSLAVPPSAGEIGGISTAVVLVSGSLLLVSLFALLAVLLCLCNRRSRRQSVVIIKAVIDWPQNRQWVLRCF